MANISKSAIIKYSAEQMYLIVANTESYPDFLPWCRDACILSEHNNIIEAQLTLAKGPLSYDFATKNTMNPHKEITIQLLKGPFSYLHGNWKFEPLSQGSNVSLHLNFSISNPLLKRTVGPFFEQAMDKMVDAFCKQADKLYS